MTLESTVLSSSRGPSLPFTLHDSYPAGHPPSHPGHPYTRFVLLSDTHALRSSFDLPVPDGDVLLHAGDLSRWDKDSLGYLTQTVDWIAAMPHRVKVVIGGNHDSILDRSLPVGYQPNSDKDVKAAQDLVRGPSACRAGIIYLEHESATFQAREGGRRWTIYGSPGSPLHGSPAFQYSSWQAEAIIGRITRPVDILLTHSPPYHTLDLTRSSIHAGCPVLAAHLPAIDPLLHVFGHIHEARGVVVSRASERAAAPPPMPAQHHGKGKHGGKGNKKGRGKSTGALPVLVKSRTEWRERAGGWRVSVNAAYQTRPRPRSGHGAESDSAMVPIIIDWREEVDAVSEEGYACADGENTADGDDVAGENDFADAVDEHRAKGDL